MEQPNLDYVKKLSGGNEEFMGRIIDVLKSELPREIEEFQQNFEKKNFKETAENVHKLKHKISILGLVKAHKEAAFFEDNLRYHQNTERYKAFALTLKSISDFLQTL